MPSDLELVLRLVVAAALGGAIGLERELSGQPAGFRTHILVALGSSLFTLISAYGYAAFLGDDAPPQIGFDPTRIAAQVVTGIGFLGAGAILRYGVTVRGLTTAASLWVVAAIGLAAGAGAYLLSGATAAITVIVLVGLRPLRKRLVRGLKREQEQLLVEADRGLELERLVREVNGWGATINHLRIEEEDEGVQVFLFVTVPPDRHPEDLPSVVAGIPGIRNVDWTR